ncbi:hypothetical protein [Pseudomonas sp.]|jgi:Arc/MetJ-type ribon-helix-helix transcriptional regulator|uniref:hypothetical protein n=1 Tax=Pseudomonas sp. TaxID=306 RepID=UPI002EDB1F07
MAGLKGMGRKEPISEEDRERQRLEFIGGAALQAAPVDTPKPAPKARKAKKAPAVRTIFSLTEDVNKQIDKLSLQPRTFKASRSDVVKAGVLALQAMSKAEVVALLAKATGADPAEDLQNDE